MEFVAVLLALIIGLIVGSLLGASRAFRMVSAARRYRSADSRLARFMPSAPPTRTPADILAGRIRVVLGGVPYDLPVLPRNASRQWIENLDASFASLALAMDDAGDNAGQILALLSTQTELMYSALLDYDRSEVLPSRDEMDEVATDAEVLHACMEVWRAANPLAAAVAENTPTTPTSGMSPVGPSSSQTPTAGDLTTSSASLTSRSFSISTPPESDSEPPLESGSRSPLKPSGSGTSSLAIDEPISDGKVVPAWARSARA